MFFLIVLALGLVTISPFVAVTFSIMNYSYSWSAVAQGFELKLSIEIHNLESLSSNPLCCIFVLSTMSQFTQLYK